MSTTPGIDRNCFLGQRGEGGGGLQYTAGEDVCVCVCMYVCYVHIHRFYTLASTTSSVQHKVRNLGI